MPAEGGLLADGSADLCAGDERGHACRARAVVVRTERHLLSDDGPEVVVERERKLLDFPSFRIFAGDTSIAAARAVEHVGLQ